MSVSVATSIERGNPLAEVQQRFAGFGTFGRAHISSLDRRGIVLPREIPLDVDGYSTRMGVRFNSLAFQREGGDVTTTIRLSYSGDMRVDLMTVSSRGWSITLKEGFVSERISTDPDSEYPKYEFGWIVDKSFMGELVTARVDLDQYNGFLYRKDRQYSYRPRWEKQDAKNLAVYRDFSDYQPVAPEVAAQFQERLEGEKYLYGLEIPWARNIEDKIEAAIVETREYPVGGPFELP